MSGSGLANTKTEVQHRHRQSENNFSYLTSDVVDVPACHTLSYTKKKDWRTLVGSERLIFAIVKQESNSALKSSK